MFVELDSRTNTAINIQCTCTHKISPKTIIPASSMFLVFLAMTRLNNFLYGKRHFSCEQKETATGTRALRCDVIVYRS